MKLSKIGKKKTRCLDLLGNSILNETLLNISRYGAIFHTFKGFIILLSENRSTS
jgi:hypothetical protein